VFSISTKSGCTPYGNGELRAYEDVKTSKNYEYYTSLSAWGGTPTAATIVRAGDGDYYNREWWLYVPESAKKRMPPARKWRSFFSSWFQRLRRQVAQRTAGTTWPPITASSS
jgi:hypothetical protein